MSRITGDDERVLDAVAGRHPSDAGWVRVNCPFCEQREGKADRKQSFGVNLLSGYFK